ncbi:glycosyltransferase, partial [Candidatus Woesearchaeota archaeon]|nr:glycosyltransferase [Candidatus Woesearchaeota archaeon]
MNNLEDKKKLLITTDAYLPKRDGLVVFLEKTIPSLTKEYDITIAAPLFSKNKIKSIGDAKAVGFPVSDRIKISGYNGVRISRKNRKKLKKLVKESDIVFSQDLAFLGGLSIIYGKRYKKPVFNYVHQITWEHLVDVLSIPRFLKYISSLIMRIAVNYLYNRCSALLVPYKELADELEQKGVTSKKLVVALGVDTERFKPPEDKFKAKKEIGINPNSKVIGYCGRISREKDLATLKKAYLRLKKDYPGIKLLIVGDGPEEEMKKLRRIPDVNLTGAVKDVVPYLQAMDIFVMPSLTETTSLATIEAMSTGLAVVSTKVGYIKEYIIHKFNGMFFGKQNDYILRKRIELLLND